MPVLAPISKSVSHPKSSTPINVRKAPRARLKDEFSDRQKAILESAKEVASYLFDDNDRLLGAQDLPDYMAEFDWFPGGSSHDCQAARLTALRETYATQLILENHPNAALALGKLLKKKLKLSSGASSAWLRCMIPLKRLSEKRKTTVYAEIGMILSYFKRMRFTPGQISTSLKAGSSLSKFIDLERAHRRKTRPARKATKPGQPKKIRTLKSIVDLEGIKSGSRLIVELEARKRSWHVVHYKVLEAGGGTDIVWSRIVSVLAPTLGQGRAQ